MSFLTYLLAFLLGVLVADLAHALHKHHRRRYRRIRLNLAIEGNAMSINVGQTATGRIAPTDSSGASAPVTSIVWAASPDGVYSITVAADGLSAVFTALAAGSASATVTAVNATGSPLAEVAVLPEVVVPVPVADKLGLTITSP